MTAAKLAPGTKVVTFKTVLVGKEERCVFAGTEATVVDSTEYQVKLCLIDGLTFVLGAKEVGKTLPA